MRARKDERARGTKEGQKRERDMMRKMDQHDRHGRHGISKKRGNMGTENAKENIMLGTQMCA